MDLPLASSPVDVITALMELAEGAGWWIGLDWWNGEGCGACGACGASEALIGAGAVGLSDNGTEE